MRSEVDYLRCLIAQHRAISRPMPFLWTEVELECAPKVFNPLLSDSSFALAQELSSRSLAEMRVADLGCGCGLLSVTALQQGASSVVATDSNPRAVQSAKENIRRIGMSGRASVLETNSTSAVTGAFDLIVFNPPFFAISPSEAWLQAFCDSDRSFLHDGLSFAKRQLRPNGSLLLAHGDPLTSELGDLLEEHDLEVESENFVPGRQIPVILSSVRTK